MNRKTVLFLLAGLLIFMGISCKKDTIVASSTVNSRYYPLHIGKSVTYQVDSIQFFDVTMTSDTARYQIMETIDSPFTDNSGRTAYRINRMRRNSDTSAWQTINIYYTNLTYSGLIPQTAERVDDNQRYVKLLFPPVNNESWNGNKYINTDSLTFLQGWNYVYSNVNVGQNVNGLQFDSTLVVTQENNQNLIQKDLEQEMYATGVGLIYKISEHVSKQNVANGWDKPEKGYIITMNVIAFKP